MSISRAIHYWTELLQFDVMFWLNLELCSTDEKREKNNDFMNLQNIKEWNTLKKQHPSAVNLHPTKVKKEINENNMQLLRQVYPKQEYSCIYIWVNPQTEDFLL